MYCKIPIKLFSIIILLFAVRSYCFDIERVLITSSQIYGNSPSHEFTSSMGQNVSSSTYGLSPNYALNNGVYKPIHKLTGIKKLKEITKQINYPNQLNIIYSDNKNIKIYYSISEEQHIKISILDILGRKLSILTNGIVSSGKYEIGYKNNLSKGIYFISLEGETFNDCKKFINLK